METLFSDKNLIKERNSLTINFAFDELFSVLATIMDSFMLALVSQAYLSSISLAGQILSLYVYATFALSRSIMLLTTQYFGKKDKDSINSILNTGLYFSIFICVLFFIILRFFSTNVMRFLTNDTELIMNGSMYLRYVSYTCLFNAFTKVVVNIFKSTNTEKYSTRTFAISNICKFILNLIFIFGFITGVPFGLKGAAFSTVGAALIELLVCIYFSFKNPYSRFSLLKFLKINPYFFKEITKYSIPIIVQNVGWALADTITVSVIGHMERAYIDAFAFVKIFSYIPNAILTGNGICFGVLIGRELGQNALRKAKQLGDEGMKYSIKLAVVMSILIAALSSIGLFLKHLDSNLLPYFIFVILVFSYNFFGKTIINFINCGPLIAGGETSFLAVIDLFNMWIIIAPISCLLFYIFKVPNFITLIFIYSSEYTKMPLVLSHYYKYVWVRDLTKNDWYLPLSGSFIDQYKRNRKLKYRIMASELFTMRFENSTNFIFSLNNDNYNEAIGNFHKYLLDMGIDNNIAYKITLAIEELYTLSKEKAFNIKGLNSTFSCDIGVRIKDNKIRFIYYDNGVNIKDCLDDDNNINIKVLKSISEKLLYKRTVGLNKVLIRINR